MTRAAQTAVAVAVSFVGLYLIDRELARVEQRELAAEASTAWQEAERLYAQHDAEAALPLYRRALTLQRNSRTYQLGVARASVDSGRQNEALQMLQTVLGREPNFGPANLEMARLLRRRGDTGSAAAYYHRSIYGVWPQGRADEPPRVRVELAEMLAADHRNQELLSELLLLDEYSHGRPELALEVAHWYLRAGSAARASAVYRTLTKSDATSAEAYAGLGDAELAVGDYRAAQSAYSNALRRGHRGVADRMVLAVELAQLDPTQRRMSTAERERRSAAVLARTLRVMAACDTPNADLQARGENALSRKNAEELLDPAEEIWRFISQSCPAAAQTDTPLRTLMDRLAQQP